MPSSRCPRGRRIGTIRAIAIAIALTLPPVDATFSGTLTRALPMCGLLAAFLDGAPSC
jgi:hypothetical protein